MRCAEITCASWGMPNSLSIATACCMISQSEEDPITTPTRGLAGCACSLMSILQLLPGQPLQGFAIFFAGLFEYMRWQGRCRGGFFPVGHGLQVVAHELLVERRR